jgi:hypothetical protein
VPKQNKRNTATARPLLEPPIWGGHPNSFLQENESSPLGPHPPLRQFFTVPGRASPPTARVATPSLPPPMARGRCYSLSSDGPRLVLLLPQLRRDSLAPSSDGSRPVLLLPRQCCDSLAPSSDGSRPVLLVAEPPNLMSFQEYLSSIRH